MSAAIERWRAVPIEPNPRDQCDKRLMQAECLAHSLFGCGGDAFRNLNDDIQDGILWLLADLISEARQALQGGARA